VAELSQWLKIMLGEVARKREEQSQAAAEHQARNAEERARESGTAGPPPRGH
jgi:hypothetical protein